LLRRLLIIGFLALAASGAVLVALALLVVWHTEDAAAGRA
jgi:hypothetical protein